MQSSAGCQPMSEKAHRILKRDLRSVGDTAAADTAAGSDGSLQMTSNDSIPLKNDRLFERIPIRTQSSGLRFLSGPFDMSTRLGFP